MKIATLFSGGGVLDCAFRKFQCSASLAVECDEERPKLSSAIADCYEMNHSAHLIRQPVEHVNWQPYSGEWFLVHASPSCKNFSVANFEGIEGEKDINSAQGVASALESLRPHYFTLEQVRGYLGTVSFQIIVDALKNMGYSITYDILNSYYYGVPQERERLILTSCKDGSLVGLPPIQRPVGWGEVLKHRIHFMKCSSPTPAQIAVLEETLALYPDVECFLVQRRGNRSRPPAIRQVWQPAPVITCAIFTDEKGANRQSFFDIWYKGEWLTLSTRDMAMLQSIPEWYKLPSSTRDAGAIIGNGVPTKLYEAVLEQIFKHYQKNHGHNNVTMTSGVWLKEDSYDFIRGTNASR